MNVVVHRWNGSRARSEILTLLATASLAAALVLAGAPAPADAASGIPVGGGATPVPSAGVLPVAVAGAEGRTCAVGLSETPSGQDPASAAEPTVACFDSPEAAADHAVTAHAAAERAAAPSALAVPAATSRVFIAWVTKDKNWKGENLLLYAQTGSGCGTGSTYGFPDSSRFGYKNNISSVMAFEKCWITLYDKVNYGGTRLTCTPECGDLGGLDNRTESIVLRPVGSWG